MGYSVLCSTDFCVISAQTVVTFGKASATHVTRLSGLNPADAEALVCLVNPTLAGLKRRLAQACNYMPATIVKMSGLSSDALMGMLPPDVPSSPGGRLVIVSSFARTPSMNRRSSCAGRRGSHAAVPYLVYVTTGAARRQLPPQAQRTC